MPLAGLGHGDRAAIALADGGLPADHPRRAPRPSTGCSTRRSRAAATGADDGRASSRAAGTSSTATSSIPTSTTRRWSCWRLQRTAPGRRPDGAGRDRAAGVDWLLAMQNRDGGWAAFDLDIDNEVLTKVPFADHNAMLDPSCADITGRVLEALGALGYRADHPAVARALAYLWQTQEPRRLLVRPLGRQLHLRHLAGPPRPRRRRLPTWTTRRCARAADWLESVQQADGGWGEIVPTATTTRRWTGQGHADRLADRLGRARPDRRRRARAREPSARGIEYLLDTQQPDGTWDEAGSPAPASRASST